MSAGAVLLTILAYFAAIILVSWLSGRNKDGRDVFYDGGKKSPWALVAFAMIGSCMSGVTFISVPGMVGTIGFGYLQMCIGFFLGYLVIAFVLTPLYFRLNVVSIYQYLDNRFGTVSYRTGAWFFFLSKMLGASVRLYLVCLTLQQLLFGPMGLPFWLNAQEKLNAEVPLDPRIERVPEKSTDKYDYYKISFATFGRRIYGLMSVPTNKARAPFPVRVEVPGAGCGFWALTLNPAPDAICCFLTVNNYEPDPDDLKGSKEKWDAINAMYREKYGTREYSSAGLSESREAGYFYPVILGIKTARSTGLRRVRTQTSRASPTAAPARAAAWASSSVRSTDTSPRPSSSCRR